MADAEIKTSFTFTKLVVGDLGSSMTFYEKVFDLSNAVQVKATLGGRPIREAIYSRSDGTTMLILLAFIDDNVVMKGDLILGVVSNNVELVVDRVVAAGGGIIDAPYVVDAFGTPTTVAIVIDNEGHMIQIFERRWAEAA